MKDQVSHISPFTRKSRIGKSIETENSLVVSEGWVEGQELEK